MHTTREQHEPFDNMVEHPDHYQSETGLEAIDVIEAFTFDLKGIEAVYTGNILKYMCRWKKKNGLQDLKKAQYYINKYLSLGYEYTVLFLIIISLATPLIIKLAL